MVSLDTCQYTSLCARTHVNDPRALLFVLTWGDYEKGFITSGSVFCARLASFRHLGLISDPLMFSKFYNGIHDPKGQE